MSCTGPHGHAPHQEMCSTGVSTRASQASRQPSSGYLAASGSGTTTATAARTPRTIIPIGLIAMNSREETPP